VHARALRRRILLHTPRTDAPLACEAYRRLGLRLMQQLPLDLAQPPPPTLDNFAPGPNAQVVALLRQWRDRTLGGACVYLWGAPGAGKTHLLRAATHGRTHPGQAARYVPSGMALARELAHGMQLLAVDDVDALDEAGQAALFTLLNQGPDSGLRLLLAGGIAPAGLTLRADVATRISQGLVLQVKALSDEDKREALREHARARGFALTADAAEYLLRHGRRDLASLMRVLDAADRYSLQTQRAVTLPLLREVLQQGGDGQPDHLPAM
jgi:DnaA family protein